MAVLLFLSLVCLYYTFTRSAWIACVIGLFAVAIIGRRRLMLGHHGRGHHGVARRAPIRGRALRGPRLVDQRRGLFIELAVLALQLLGRRRCRLPPRTRSPASV